MTTPDVLPSMESDSSSAGFYQAFLAEREEILKNKWYMSERAARDVGFDAALIDWVLNHREEWVSARKVR